MLSFWIQLASHNFQNVPAGVSADLLSFYSQPVEDSASRKKRKRWEKTQKELAQLRAAPPAE
jgi:hypothetical protein